MSRLYTAKLEGFNIPFYKMEVNIKALETFSLHYESNAIISQYIIVSFLLFKQMMLLQEN